MTQNEVVSEVARASPVVTVGGLTLFGVGLSDWVLIVTLAYTFLQIYFLLRDKWWRKRKEQHGRK